MFKRVNSPRVKPDCRHTRACGFTLLEVMISLAVLAIGVMGIIGLQASTYKQLQTSQNISKAAMLASDMADRMLANQDQVIVGAYTHDARPAEPPSPNCASATCTAAELAAYDVWYWQTELRGVAPDGAKTPGSLPSASGEVYAADAGEFIILVRWDDDLDGSTGKGCAAQNPDDLDCYALNLGCLGALDDTLDGTCP